MRLNKGILQVLTSVYIIMKIVNDKIELNNYDNKAFNMYFSGENVAFFDIETTGLFASRDIIILSGILMQDGCYSDAASPDNRWNAHQILASSPADERDVLKETLYVLNRASVVVTYNGRGFDIPFLAERCKKHGLFDEYEDMARKLYHLDLYHILSKYSPLRQTMPSMTQQHIEAFMGFSDLRKDEISGRESVTLFKKYMIGGDLEHERKILLHNHDDIAQLGRILPAIGNADLHRALFSTGFPCGRFIVQNVKISRDGLTVTARTRLSEDAEDYISFPSPDRPYSVQMSKSTGTCEYFFPSEDAARGVQIVDAAKILDNARAADVEISGASPDAADAGLSRLPGFESGYLVLKQNSEVHHLAVNSFLIEFLRLQ